jgi:hypothetical protein
MKRIYIAVLAVLAGLLIGTGAVYAGVNTVPPKVVVKSNGKVIQTARVHAHSWYYYNNGEYVYSESTAPSFKYPKVATMESVKLNIYLRYPVRPERVYLRTHAGRFIGVGLTPIENENGKVVAWKAGTYRNYHHRYVLFVRWPETEGRSYGTATYTMNLKAS